MKKTKVINIISGPGTGKSVMASFLFGELKIEGFDTELVQEYAKKLIRRNEEDKLNNQYSISEEQYKELKENDGIEYIVTDGSLLHGLVYNRINKNNISNVIKTEKQILKWYNKFDNIVFFLERDGNIKYTTNSRLETEDEAKKIDNYLKGILDNLNIKYEKVFISETKKLERIINIIKNEDF